MDEQKMAQHWRRKRVSRSSYMDSAAFPTRTKTRVFLHWKPSRTLTFTRCTGPKFILMSFPAKWCFSKKRMKNIVSQLDLGHEAGAMPERAGVTVNA